jgi:molecular chaperone GrpE
MSDEEHASPAESEEPRDERANGEGIEPEESVPEADENEADELTGENEEAEEHEADLEAKLDERDEQIEEFEAELDRRDERIEELESKFKRVQADFQNYKKRREREEQRLRETATEDLVTRLLDVRDNLVRATEQDEDAEIREGVEATLREFDYVLGGEDVSTIEPEPGTEIDPQRHEVMVRVESDRPEGTIDELYTSGYEMGEKVLRPAQVTVSEGTEDE